MEADTPMAPRKRKDVTPPPEPAENVPSADSDLPDDLDALFAQAVDQADEVGTVPMGLVPGEVTAEALTKDVAAMVERLPGYLADVEEEELPSSARAVLRATEALAAFSTALEALRSLPTLALDTPDQRELAVRLYNRLEPVETTVGLWRRMVESSFREFLTLRGADRATLPGGRFVAYNPPADGWEADGQGMRRDLDRLVAAGVLTREQVDEVVAVEVYYRVNNTRANALANHMGDDVKGAIEANRRRVPGKGVGKVTIPRVDA